MLKWTIRPRLMGDMVSPEYLEDMARSGWQLKVLGRGYLYFKKCAPETVAYAVDVMSKERADVENSLRSPRVQEYIGMCQDFGWEYVDSDGVFFVFKGNEGAVPLQTDEEAYRGSVQHLRRMRTLRQFALAGLGILGMVILFALTGLYSVLLSYTNMLIIGALCLYVSWLILRWLCRVVILRLTEKQLAAGSIPKEIDDRKWAWIEKGTSLALGMVLSGILGALESLPLLPVMMFAVMVVLLWSFGGDLLYHVFWTHFQRSRLASVVLVGLILPMLIGDIRVPQEWVGEDPDLNDPYGAAKTVWEPFVTEEDLGWSAMDGAESHREGTRHAVQYRYSALGANSFTYELFYSPYELAVDSFCSTAERYSLPGVGVVEISDWKEYDLDAAPYMEISGWDAFWNHYLFCVDDWAMHVMTRDVLTEEQMEILASKMNYFIAENVN